jgi:hypothetical protein
MRPTEARSAPFSRVGLQYRAVPMGYSHSNKERAGFDLLAHTLRAEHGEHRWRRQCRALDLPPPQLPIAKGQAASSARAQEMSASGAPSAASQQSAPPRHPPAMAAALVVARHRRAAPPRDAEGSVSNAAPRPRRYTARGDAKARPEPSRWRRANAPAHRAERTRSGAARPV